MRSASRRRTGQAGFTLVEVLVALGLLALLGVMLSDGLRFGVRVWERTREASSALGDVSATQNFLRRRLEGPTRAEGFGGEADLLSVQALWMADLGSGTFHVFELGLVRDDGVAPGALVLSWRPAEEGAPPDPALVGSRVLLDGVDALDIRYFGALPDDPLPEPRWREAWPLDAGRPALVLIDLRFADPRRRWPPFVAAPYG